MNALIATGTKVLRRDIAMTISEVDETNRLIILRKDQDRRIFDLSFDEFSKEYLAGELKFIVQGVEHSIDGEVSKRTLFEYTEEEVDRAERLKGWILSCLDENGNWNSNTQDRTMNKTAFALSIDVKGKMLSDRQIRRMYARWDASGRRIEGLIPRTKNRGNRVPRLSQKLTDLCMTFINKYYMSETRPSISTVHKLIAETIEENVQYSDLGTVSRSTVERMIKSISIYDRDKARYGWFEVMRKYPHGSPVIKPRYLMQKVEIDHTPVDLAVLCDETGELLKKVWLTTVLECSSKMITGYYLAAHPPCTRSVIQALKHSAFPKGDTLKRNPDLANSSWPCWGLPSEASTDNGPDLISKDTRHSLVNLGIDLHLNPKGRPNYKGSVERAQRTTIEQTTELLPGRTFSNYIVRGDYKSEKKAITRLSDLRNILEIWIVTIYHNKFQRGIKEKPIDAWNRLLIESPPVRLPESVEYFNKLFWKQEERTLQKNGISYDNIVYQSVELQKIARQFGHTKKVSIFIDETDISVIHVQLPGTFDFIDAHAEPCAYMELKLSVDDHHAVIAHLIKNNVDAGGKALAASKFANHQLLAGWNEILRIREEAMNSTKKSKRTTEARRANAAKSKFNKETPPKKGVLKNSDNETPFIPNTEDL